jgi:peptidoglycan/LPS O-acetylase OafA/YrhL
MVSLEQKSLLASHRSTGFDYIRIVLAIAIVAWHSVLVVLGPEAEKPFYGGPLRPLVHFLVPSFFALSGYLVAGSLLRTNHLPTFLTLRVLRIFPALCCEVVISALIIGPLLTTLPLVDYFSDPVFHRYFSNIIGDIQYSLPGVFASNTTDFVNVQLWTIPFELECYIGISLISLLTLHRRPTIFVGLLIIATVLLTALNYQYWDMQYDVRPSGRSIVWAFLWGVAIYFFRTKLPHNFYWFIAALAASWLLLSQPETEFLAAPALAYVTAYVGLLQVRRTPLLLAGDISYGIYLYAFVIQQAVYQILPNHRTWLENFVISLTVACAFGYVSWVAVERPVLNKKRPVVAYVKSVCDRVGTFARKSLRSS